MAVEFTHDVFLSHSNKDKIAVREVAERLRGDGLRVWFDEWEIRPGDSIPAKIEEGLEHSRVLVLCMSKHAFGSDWAQLEACTFRFRDPLNKERRFIPLRLEDTHIKGSLAQFLYINWLPEERENEYAKLLHACQFPAQFTKTKPQAIPEGVAARAIRLNTIIPDIRQYSFSPDGKRVLTREGGNTSDKNALRLWDMETGQCVSVCQGHEGYVDCSVWSSDQRYVLSGGHDNTVRLWDVNTGACLQVFRGHTDIVWCAELNADNTRLLSGGIDQTVRLWDLNSGRNLCIFEGHTAPVAQVIWSQDQSSAITACGRDEDTSIRLWHIETGNCLLVLDAHTAYVTAMNWSSDQRHVLCGEDKGAIRLWDLKTGTCLRTCKGHTNYISDIAWSRDQRRALSSCWDNTLRLWDLDSGRCLQVLEGHTNDVRGVQWIVDNRLALSYSWDNTLRLWDLDSGRCLQVLEGHQATIWGMGRSADGRICFSGDEKGGVQVWDLSKFIGDNGELKATMPGLTLVPDQVQYINAKVLLVGNSGAGKTGLSNRLALDMYTETDSTVGAWATQWKLPLLEDDSEDADGIFESECSATEPSLDREVWLWDFGGQADQRLIHQLYMDQTQVAALVFDPQKQEVLEGLKAWDRDLTRAASDDYRKLLVAGRIDTGGLRSLSRHQVEKFAREHGFARYIETSAKENIGCEELREAICELIDWKTLAKRTTPKLFRSLKREIVGLKDEGRVLMRFNELREALALRISEVRFSDEELKAVISLLTGPGVVWEIGFGSWVLLAPELINTYAQAVIRTIQEDDSQLGCITEECVLGGKLSYPNELERLPEEEERILLLALHRLLVENNLCLSEPTGTGTLLVFPTYARRERPDLIEHPSVLVSYQIEGFLDDIYATLVVWLHRVSPFTTKNFWNGAADFETITGQKLGVKLSRKAAGKAELLVYFDPELPVGERMIFNKYVQEHLLRKVKDRDQVKRLRHWICEKCGEPVANRERAMQRLNDNGAEAKIICVNCEQYVRLWDEMEEAFADTEIMRRVRELEAEATRELDNESKERALIGDVISTVGLAGQISREFPVSDHGIDMEIEFKDDAGAATGRRLYLQLKSGDSYLTKRIRDGVEMFRIAKQRHVKYWMDQAYPVMLVIRSSNGKIRWMEIRDHLKQITNNGEKQVRQIVFKGERFDVMSIRRWREEALDPQQV